ncbi:hypothetical protein [Pseudomonas mediterranea]|uniref:hypothetical protein n=1 Tax=Pseudomonas mediterranea TaxID=183795 RepID=UPI0006D88A10|nr:hypothetical protein [Pseudomonas mediterranea]
MHYQSDPVHMDPDGQWYFYTPDLQARYGPYPDNQVAYAKVNEYIAYLDSQAPAPKANEGEALSNQMVAEYMMVRDEIEAMNDKHKTEMKPLKDRMTAIEGSIQAYLNDNHMDGFKANGATVYTERVLRANIGDKSALNQFIMQTGNVELLQTRLSTTVLKEYMSANNDQVPPGVKVDFERAVRVRKA